MLHVSLSSLFKFLVGILLVQGATVLLVLAALETELAKTAPLFALLGVTIGVLTALWCHSIADGARTREVAKVKESFSREREKLRVRAEQEKTREVRNTHRQVEKVKRKTQEGGNLKTGMVIGGVASAGVVMLLAQFVTLGLLTITTAGGAALGYGIRARQERLGWTGKRLHRDDERQLPRQEKAVQLIEAQIGDDSGKKPKGPAKLARNA